MEKINSIVHSGIVTHGSFCCYHFLFFVYLCFIPIVPFFFFNNLIVFNLGFAIALFFIYKNINKTKRGGSIGSFY